MISSGIFVLPGLAHASAGPAVMLSYFIAGLFAMAGLFSQAELVSAMPKSGGTYFYVTRSMGPALGTIDGLMTWLSISLKSSFALVGMAAFTSMIVDVNQRMIALVLCSIFLAINIMGLKEAVRLQVFFVVLLFLSLGLYIVMGVPSVRVSHFTPFFSKGIYPVFSTAGFVFISFGGVLKVASLAEEVKNPGRTVPLAMMLSFLVVGVLYLLIIFVTSGVLSPAELDHSLTPLFDGAGVFMGKWGQLVMGIAAVLAFVSTANAGIMSASRYPFALSRDRLLPEGISRINRRLKTPVLSILITGVFMSSVLFFDLNLLVKVASSVLILTFIFSCLCVIVMRESGLQNYQPKFRSPFYPWIQIAGIFGCWLLLVNMGRIPMFIGSVLVAGCFAVYWFYGRLRAKKDFALLHLIERVTAKEFVDVSLEAELKDIIRERDDIVEDRFDNVIEESIVLDLEKSMSVDEFFNIAADKMSERLGIDHRVIHTLLLDREEQSSTVLSPGLAIPHIIMDGKYPFTILLARCKKGVIFPESGRSVTTIFVIAGSKYERNFHLRALSAIAQIVQDTHFEKRWLSAKNEEALRDIVLLGKRKRHK